MKLSSDVKPISYFKAHASEIIREIAHTSELGFGNLRLTVLANVGPHSPFFPAAYHDGGAPALAIATESADLAMAAFERAGSLDEARARASRLDLSEAAKLIDQPLLMITGRLDRLIPWEQTKKIVDEAPNAEFVMWDEGNHVCNNIPYKYRPLTADWLAEKLSA